MKFETRNAERKDAPAMYEVYSSAFSTTLIGQQVFPQTSQASRDFWQSGIASDLDNPHCQLLVVTDASSSSSGSSASSDGDVVAYAKWIRPGAPSEGLPPLDAWPQDGNPALAAEFFGGLSAAHERIMKDEPHWYLELIAVHQEWMGKRAASSLMRWGLDRADEQALPVFLEATEMALPMYERYGFRVIEQEKFETPRGTVIEAYMRRDAKNGGAA